MKGKIFFFVEKSQKSQKSYKLFGSLWYFCDLVEYILGIFNGIIKDIKVNEIKLVIKIKVCPIRFRLFSKTNFFVDKNVFQTFCFSK